MDVYSSCRPFFRAIANSLPSMSAGTQNGPTAPSAGGFENNTAHARGLDPIAIRGLNFNFLINQSNSLDCSYFLTKYSLSISQVSRLQYLLANSLLTSITYQEYHSYIGISIYREAFTFFQLGDLYYMCESYHLQNIQIQEEISAYFSNDIEFLELPDYINEHIKSFLGFNVDTRSGIFENLFFRSLCLVNHGRLSILDTWDPDFLDQLAEILVEDPPLYYEESYELYRQRIFEDSDFVLSLELAELESSRLVTDSLSYMEVYFKPKVFTLPAEDMYAISLALTSGHAEKLRLDTHFILRYYLDDDVKYLDVYLRHYEYGGSPKVDFERLLNSFKMTPFSTNLTPIDKLVCRIETLLDDLDTSDPVSRISNTLKDLSPIIYYLYKAQTPMDYIVTCLDYLNRTGNMVFLKSMRDYIVTHSSGFYTTSLKDDDNNVFSILSDFFEMAGDKIASFDMNGIKIHLSKVLTCALAFNVIGDDKANKLNWFGLIDHHTRVKWEEATDVPKLISQLFHSIAQIIKSSFVSPSSSDELSVTTEDELVKAIMWLMEYEHKRDQAGKEIPGNVPDVLWRKNLEKTWVASNRIPLSPPYRSTMAQLKKNLIAMKADAISTSDRPMPFNLCIWSSPGTGKSTWIVPCLASTILSGLGVVQDYPVDKIHEVIADVNLSDKYLSAYDSNKHLVVVLDEYSSAKSDMQRDNQLKTNICSLLGEATFFPTKAEISEKGKVSYRPYVNILTDNNAGFGIGEYINNQNAFWRRIHMYLEVRVKPEFQVEGHLGTHINPQLVQDGSIDCVEFRIWHTSNAGPTRTHPEDDDAGWYNYAQIRDIILLRARAHSSIKSGVVKTRERAAELEQNKCIHDLVLCPECSGSEFNPSQVLQELGIKSEINLNHFEMRSDAYTVRDIIDNPETFDHFYDFFRVFLIELIKYIFYSSLLWFCYISSSTVYKKYEKVVEDTTEKLALGYSLIARSDNLLARAEKLTSISIDKPMKSLVGICLIISSACYLSASLKSSKKDDDEETVFCKQSGSDVTNLFGSPPPTNCEITKNPYDVRDGFVIYGKKSSMTHDVWQRKLSQNFIQIIVKDISGQSKGVCSLLGVQDQNAIGPWHTIRHMNNPNNRLTVRTVVYDEVLDSKYYHSLFEMSGYPGCAAFIANDIGVLRLSDHNAFANIIECFPKDVNFSGSLLKVDGELMKHDFETCDVLFENMPANKARIHYYDDSTKVTADVYDGYSLSQNVRGNCGGIYTIIKGKQKFIAGLLIAGVNAQSGNERFRHCCGIIKRDLLEAAINDVNNKGIVFSIRSSLPISQNRYLQNVEIGKGSRKDNHLAWIEPSKRGVTQFLGSVKIGTRKMKSDVVWYPNGKDLYNALPEAYHHDLTSPKFYPIRSDGEYYSPEKHVLNQLSKPVHNVNMLHLQAAIKHLTSRYVSISDFAHDQILDPDTCVSGSDNNPFVKSMDLTTGTGFGYDGKKSNYVQKMLKDHPNSSFSSNGYILKESFKKEIEEIIVNYSNGIRDGPIMEMLTKDEPRSKSKVAIRKIRMFAGVPISNYIISKMYYGMFMGIFMRNPIRAETVGGINSFGSEWSKVYEHLSRFPNIFNGDFSAYDKHLSILMLNAAFQVIHNVKDHYGKIISSEHRTILETLASDMCNPILLLGKDLLFQPGSLASGLLLTFILNNIVNSLYIRLAYLDIFSDKYTALSACLDTFDDNVSFSAGGDDNATSFSDAIREEFNFVTVQKFFKSIGMKFTPADKSDRVYKYEPVSQATIFKRRWVFDEQYLIWKAPLERHSIGKMLTICLRSKHVSLKTQQTQALKQAVAELSQYSREEFNDVVSILRRFFQQEFPSYDELLKIQSTSEITPWIGDYEIPVIDLTGSLSCDDSANQQQQQITLSNMKQSEAFEKRSTVVLPEKLFNLYGSRTPGRDNLQLVQHPDCLGDTGNFQGVWCNSVTSYYRTAESNDKSPDEVLGADNIDVMTSSTSDLQQQTASFKQVAELYSVDPSGVRDSTFDDGKTDNVQLGDFLSRPVRINEFTWNVSNNGVCDFLQGIDPWVLWQSDPRVIHKISNYAYLNMDLKLRFVINGSRFQYGKLMIVYVPYGDLSTTGTIRDGANQVFREQYKVFQSKGGTSPSSFRQTTLQYLSTYPHVFVSPGSNNVAELTLPFIWHLSYLNINGINGINKESPGKLFFLPMNALRTAKSETDAPVKITTFAWAENANLVMPTEFVPTSSMDIPMMGKGKDEYPGPVSTLASGTASIASKLTSVPVIGKFAKATEIGAGAVSNVAKIFGFNTPTDDRPATIVTNRPYGRMSVTSGVDSSHKLTLDPKQELTVDPSVVGAKNRDEMSFVSIATREQYIGQSYWFEDGGQDAANPKLLFSSLVRPSQTNIVESAKVVSTRTYRYASNTPAGQISACFAYWRGSVTYRVEVVASSFHSGRIKLQFDPFVRSAAVTTSDIGTDEVNARYTMIMDLDQEREVEFTIPYCNPRPYLRTPTTYFTNSFRPAHLGDTTQDVASNFNPEFDMGVFSITIVNDLVAPQSSLRGAAAQDKDTSPVYVNVYVKMNDDFQVSQPEDTAEFHTSYFGPYSSEVPPSLKEDTNFVNEENVLFHSTDPSDISNVFFGERCVSLRNLCKRYNIAFTGAASNGASNNMQWAGRSIPIYPPNTVHNKKRFNTFSSFFMPSFLCVRGGQRMKLMVIPGTLTNDQVFNGYLQIVERQSRPLGSTVNWSITGGTANPSNIEDSIPKGFGGSALTYAGFNPVLEFETPFYSNTRFYLGPQYENVDSAGAEKLLENKAMKQILYTYYFLVSSETNENSQVLYYGAAEDFSLSFYLGSPPLWEYTEA